MGAHVERELVARHEVDEGLAIVPGGVQSRESDGDEIESTGGPREDIVGTGASEADALPLRDAGEREIENRRRRHGGFPLRKGESVASGGGHPTADCATSDH